jgi:hypothetical protein
MCEEVEEEGGGGGRVGWGRGKVWGGEGAGAARKGDMYMYTYKRNTLYYTL